MKTNTSSQHKIISLAIDTAIEAGSFSIWKNEELIDAEIGNEQTSRSVDILAIINSLLTRNGLKQENLKNIIYTKGPGSYTGLKVSIAIILGLKKSLELDIYSVSVLDAIGSDINTDKSFFSAMLLSKNKVAYQKNVSVNRFRDKIKSEPIKYLTKSNWFAVLNHSTNIWVIDKRLYQNFELNESQKKSNTQSEVICASDNVSICTYEYYLKNRRYLSKDKSFNIIYS